MSYTESIESIELDLSRETYNRNKQIQSLKKDTIQSCSRLVLDAAEEWCRDTKNADKFEILKNRVNELNKYVNYKSEDWEVESVVLDCLSNLITDE